MKLRVNYKDEIIDITYTNLYIDNSELHIVFNKDLEAHFQFFINYLIVNCIKYDTIYNSQSKTIITNSNHFRFTIAIMNPIKSSDVDNSLLEAIRNYKSKLDMLKDSLAKLQKEYDANCSAIKNCNIKLSKFEFVEKLNSIRKDLLNYEQNKLLESIKLIQSELDETRASIPNVKDLKIAFHVSELLDEETCKELLYLREHLMNRARLTRDECNQLKTLKKLSEYMYKVDANELKNVYSKLSSEQCENAAKYVESHKNMKLKLEEILREFYG